MEPAITSQRSGHRLETLLNPRSIAIVGASERNQYSNLAMTALGRLGFGGAVHLVNRRGGTAYGRDCVTNCRSIAEPVDAAYLCVPYQGVVEAASDAIASGIKNLIVIASGFAETGAEGARREAELQALCAAADVRVLGPNCLGFRNMIDGVALGSIPFTAQSDGGAIALISTSGSVASAVAAYGVQQGVGFTHVVATGNEMDVTCADILDYVIDIPEVRAVALFLETVKDARALAAAATRARSLRKPIVVIKVGSAPATAAIAAAHTSAIVGDDRVFDAACDRLGIVRVDCFEDLVTTAAILAFTPPMKRAGIAIVSISGGVCEVASDLAPRVGATLPPFSPATQAALAEVLSDFGQAHNPLDLTGAAVRNDSLWTSVPQIVAQDEQVGLTVITWDVPMVAEPTMPNTVALIGATLAGAQTPMMLVTNYERPVNEHGRAYLARHGVGFAPSGIRHGLAAAAKLAWWSERLDRPAPPELAHTPGGTTARLVGEAETLSHLAQHGVPVVPAILARTRTEAMAAAASSGGRFVVKIVSPDIQHKSDIGGVALDLAGAEAVGEAYDRIMQAAAAGVPGARLEGVLVAPMRVGGLEMLVGVARDPHWGLVLAVGLGGVWVEALGDTALCLLPADADDVLRALRSLRAASLFGGFRGMPPVDLHKLAGVVTAIGRAALALGPDLEALEVNPLFIRGGEIEALDALATWSEPHIT